MWVNIIYFELLCSKFILLVGAFSINKYFFFQKYDLFFIFKTDTAFAILVYHNGLKLNKYAHCAEKKPRKTN